MDYPILNRAEFLIERTDVPRAFPPQNPAERLLTAVSDAVMEQRMVSVLLACSLLRKIANDYRSTGV